jgi:molybdate transport system substrate-binding protein
MVLSRMFVLRASLGCLVMAASFMSFASDAQADDARALVTIGMRRVFDKVLPAFEATYGRRFQVDYASTIDIAQRVSGGEQADLIGASRAGVDKLIEAGKVAKDAEFELGGSRIVVAVPTGRPRPDISSAEAVKSALLQAKTVSYTDPASGGPSGIQMERLLERLGINRQVNAKTRFPPFGGPVGEILARGEAEIGIQQAVELTSFPGVDVVGPLPPEMQTVTSYVIAVPKDAGHPDSGKSLMEFLRSPEGARLLVEGGLDSR